MCLGEKGYIMARLTLMIAAAALVSGTVMAAEDFSTYTDFQTIYTETPVQSYYASPDDPNFIPETEFMERADSINYDQNIENARAY